MKTINGEIRFRSTRRQSPSLSLTQAVSAGLAPDGGLYVPEFFSQRGRSLTDSSDLVTIAEIVLEEFFNGDDLTKSWAGSGVLRGIAQRAFDFPLPLKFLPDGITAVLELFHGPTLAFKDFGARFLAELLSQLRTKRIVLVATSGDTGGAVASAFARRAGFRVVILFPEGRVSERQRRQLTTWGSTVQALAVRGDFDDCQRLVKEAFKSPEFPLISANSINLGRLLPQVVYYAWASLQYRAQRGTLAGFIIPSGNLGNAVAAFWAKEMGFPIREIVLATNANRSIQHYFQSGQWNPTPTVATLANAMDVGNPSNMERLRDLYPNIVDLKKMSRSFSVSDDQIRSTIQAGPQRWGEVWCPHTATAVFAREQLPSNEGWVIVSTAHPAKFETLVEPLIGRPIDLPQGLAAVIRRPENVIQLSPDISNLSDVLRRTVLD